MNKILSLLIPLAGVAVLGAVVFNYQHITGLFQADQVAFYEDRLVKDLPDYPKCQDHNPSLWHPASEKDSSGNIVCVYGHEHGDPIPDWLKASHSHTGFDHTTGFMANTSSYENTAKHAGMKGFSTTIKGVQVYARIHLASNPMDRSSRYHSYELFLKDFSGNISHFQGWLDTGDPVLDRTPYQDTSMGEKGKDPGHRPIVWASTRHACQVDQRWCIELWAMKSWGWGPDIIWGINDATSFYSPQEGNAEDISKWDLSGSLGVDRSLTVAVYREIEDLKKRGVPEVLSGEIWATQFGEIVSGPNDERCFSESIKYGQSYQNICLKNYIASTLPQITGVGNTSQKVFDSEGVEMPN